MESTKTVLSDGLISESQLKLIAELYEETSFPEERRYPALDLVQLSREEASKHIEALLSIKRGQANARMEENKPVTLSEPTLGMCAKIAVDELLQTGKMPSKNTKTWTRKTIALYWAYQQIRGLVKNQVATTEVKH